MANNNPYSLVTVFNAMPRFGFLALACLAALIAGSANATEASEPTGLIELHVPGQHLRAYVAPQRGGELVGLQYQRNNNWIELLYRGMDFRSTTDWDGKAPILWPATGRNFVANRPGDPLQLGWTSNGHFYPMPIHGFARDLPWRFEQQQSTAKRAALLLSLRDNTDTLKSYPFGFRMTTEYTLEDQTLTIHQKVQASPGNDRPMPFSIGNHITFNLPLIPGGRADNVTFTTMATKHVLLDSSGRPSGIAEAYSAAAPRPVTDIGIRKPVSLSGFPSDEAWVTLKDPAGMSLTVSHREDHRPAGEPVLFNLWADPGSGFFSPEPWVGKQNSLATQDGVVLLAPGEEFEWAVVVEIRP